MRLWRRREGARETDRCSHDCGGAKDVAAAPGTEEHEVVQHVKVWLYARLPRGRSGTQWRCAQSQPAMAPQPLGL